MPTIFISYRREDSSDSAGRVYDRLEAHFGREAVFMDVDTIPFGIDFREHLAQAVGRCDILLAVIGENWLTAYHKEGPRQGQRRLDDPSDFVRIEIQSALARGIPVIPVLVGKAVMPREQELPEGLKELAYRNAAEVRTGRDFNGHADRLIRGIAQLSQQRSAEQAARQQREETERQKQGRPRQEGETRLAQLLAEALTRTGGMPTDADHEACKQLAREYELPPERVLRIGMAAKHRWLQANLPRAELPEPPQSLQGEVGQLVANSLAMKFAWIPPGRFRMGSPPGEAERSDNETQHWVTLTRGFYLGVHLVTQGPWRWVMDSNPSNFKGNNRPVDTVSWDDCQEFCRRLSELDGRRYRLPTEAEWEYACRAGTTTPFSFGDTISTDQANYDGNYTYRRGKKGKFLEITTSVGSFPANAWGLHDMHGNLWEWCQDWFGPYPTEEAIDPIGPESGSARVLRGGSWRDHAWVCRAAYRHKDGPGKRYHRLGCRVCLSLE